MKHRLESFHNLVDAFGALPTVGKKSALRFAYHVVLSDSFGAMKLAHAIEKAVRTLRRCEVCGGVSENEVCDVCLDEDRDSSLLCIVESAKDMLILEENGAFEGCYFVLEDLDDETLDRLKKIVKTKDVKEIVFALTPGLSSDGIILYTEEKMRDFNINFTKIAQGVPTGVHLENVDTLSLLKALKARMKV